MKDLWWINPMLFPTAEETDVILSCACQRWCDLKEDALSGYAALSVRLCQLLRKSLSVERGAEGRGQGRGRK